MRLTHVWTPLRRRRARAVAAASVVVSAFTLAPAPVRAADCSGQSGPCLNDDTLWPHAGTAQFVAIGSTETTGAGQVGFGLVTAYLSRPIMLTLAAPGAGAGGTRVAVIDNQVNGTFLWSYGVTRRLELDLAIPLTFIEDGSGLTPVTGGPGLRDTAARDVRFGLAYALVARTLAGSPDADRASAAQRETNDGLGIAARFEVSAPSGDADQFAGDRVGVLVPSIAADYRLRNVFLGAEVGVRIRPIAQLLNTRVGSQMVAMLGVGFDLLPRRLLSAAAEAWALPTFAAQRDVEVVGGAYTSTPNGQHIVPAEWQLSLRTAPLGDLTLQLGGGGGIPFSGDLPATTPRFRFTLGVRWEGR